ncbi:hypothetical protein BH20CHL3_BH20CHL3_02130 [soil metagenome]
MPHLIQWMSRFSLPAERGRYRPALILACSLCGLLVAIAITGIAGLAINQNVHDITQRALEYDMEIEDEGDDLRAAILDVRHYHRNLFVSGDGPAQGLTNLTRAYRELEKQIRDYAEIGIDPAENVVSASDLQAMADSYWQTVRPALDEFKHGEPEFVAAGDEGFEMLQEMEDHALIVDQLGEELAERSLANVDRSNSQSRMVLLGVLVGLVVVGLGLAWITIRVIAQFRTLYNSQQAASLLLSQALQAKSDFIADASHELRTPLTVLRGNAEAGLAIDPNTVHREILEEIVSESARMTKLVEDLLFLARSDADSVPLDTEVIAAEPLLLELAARCRILVQREGADFTTRLDGYGLLNLDAVRIEQAVMILVDNAAKYGPAGGVVHLASSTWRSELIIEVADQGEGIPKDEIPFIFDRFRRVDNAPRRQRAGTGLGLAIAKTIVDAHSGRIEVHSRFGEGTQMRIYLPLDPSGWSRAAVRPIARALELAPGQRATE